jgi:hypothetical protein
MSDEPKFLTGPLDPEFTISRLRVLHDLMPRFGMKPNTDVEVPGISSIGVAGVDVPCIVALMMTENDGTQYVMMSPLALLVTEELAEKLTPPMEPDATIGPNGEFINP